MNIDSIKEGLKGVAEKAASKVLTEKAIAMLYTLTCLICPDSVWFSED
jgi:hypothetical protein